MSESARVTSVEAIVKFESGLRTFADESSQVLLLIEQQVQRALEWLEQDAPVHWRQQIRDRYDDVAQARTALQTCRMKKVGNSGPACLEEQQTLRKAQERLRKTEEMLLVVNRCAQKVRREVDEYRGRMMGFRNRLEGDIPRTLALLEWTISSLESYLEQSVAAPGLEKNGLERNDRLESGAERRPPAAVSTRESS